jgi:hypothetical protein
MNATEPAADGGEDNDDDTPTPTPSATTTSHPAMPAHSAGVVKKPPVAQPPPKHSIIHRHGHH